MAARSIRDRITISKKEIVNDEPIPDKLQHSLISPASSAASILHENGLDGRDLNAKGSDLRFANPTKLPISLLRTGLFTILLPLFIISLLPQVILGRLLGDSTDEGVDARTSYQFLAAMFGSLIIWPISSTLCVIFALNQESNISNLINYNWTEFLGQGAFETIVAIVILWICMIPLFWLSGRLWSLAWDDYMSLKKFIKRQKMTKSTRTNLKSLLENINKDIAKL